MDKLTNEQIERLQEYYESGLGSTYIGKELGVSPQWVLRLAKKLQLVRKLPTKYTLTVDRRRLKVDDAAFDEINEISSYWIGFLMADGCIVRYQTHTPVIRINLHERDINHLYKFKEFLNSEHKVRTAKSSGYAKGNSTYCYFAVPSKQLAAKLNEFGVEPRKTQREKVIGLELNKDFWRGVIDGDGCIGTRKYMSGRTEPRLSLTGSEILCLQFTDFVKTYCPNFKGKVFYSKSAYNVRFCASTAYKIIKLLYSGNKVSLDRKDERAQSIINHPRYKLAYIDNVLYKNT